MLITEISEKDFRKLDIIGWKHERVYEKENSRICHFEWRPYHLNDLLDKEIQSWIDDGYEDDELRLKKPVTLAIHVNNDNKADREHPQGGGYFDKYMNMYSHEATFEFGFGFDHIYSSRDYYYGKGDYWRVKRKETEVIYRIHLEPRNFVLKHKKVVEFYIDDNSYVEVRYERKNADDEWKECGRSIISRNGQMTSITPVDSNNNPIK